jgi:hypothetical protein
MGGPSKKEQARIRDMLLDANVETRSQGLDECVAAGSPAVGPFVVEALARGLLLGAERLRGLHVLRDHGLALLLDDVRADGWLERVGEGVAGFREVSDILGRTFFGLATLLGVQVASIEVQPDDFARSRIGFSLGDSRIDYLPLREFKRRVVSALLDEQPKLPRVDLPLDHDRVVALVGSRYLLLAALFDWSLQWVFLGGPPQSLSDVYVDATHGDRPLTVTLEQLLTRLRAEVEEEWQRYLDPLGGIDAALVQQAAAAVPSDPVRALDLLGGLLRFVLDYGRQPGRQVPEPRILTLVCEGLALLGRAHLLLGPEQARYGEEVLRLGVQTFPGAPGVHHLHLALGEQLVRTAREAEAIAHLRRAAALGAAAEAVDPVLIEAYFRTGRMVAAAVLLEALERRGPRAAEKVDQPVGGALKAQATEVFRTLESLAGRDAKTEPPPAERDAKTEPPLAERDAKTEPPLAEREGRG